MAGSSAALYIVHRRSIARTRTHGTYRGRRHGSPRAARATKEIHVDRE